MNECVICGRPVSKSLYCDYHQRAFENLETAFKKWEYAFTIEWKEYLNRVSEEESLGKWVSEIVDYLTQESDSSR